MDGDLFVRITPELKQWLRVVAALSGATQTAIVTEALEHTLPTYRRTVDGRGIRWTHSIDRRGAEQGPA